MKLWDKGYKLNELIEDFTVGNDYINDMALVRYDCIASIAHAKMLGKVGLLTSDEVGKLTEGLKEIIKLDKEGKFTILKSEEDCHTAIERYLTEKLGDTGKKVHTARSRNDQVLVALRLYYKDNLNNVKSLIEGLIKAIQVPIKEYGSVKIPGYTHTRKAMPSSIGMWCGALSDSMSDNLKLVNAAFDLIDQSPLGSGAGYDLPIKIDKAFTAKELGFSRVQNNPIYVQNSRGKFESVMLHTFSSIMLDINKFSEDMILFSMPEFGYLILPNEFLTGSSIMPQKKNPDVLELLRASYHQMLSYEYLVNGISGSIPTGYNRDIQLTKEPVMRAFDLVQRSLLAMTLIFENLKVDKELAAKAMTKELFATEEAYKLVKRGMPFRDAYKKVAEKFK